MSAKSINIDGAVLSPPKTREILRYAFGTAIVVGVSYSAAWPVAFLTPVFALMFLGSPAPCPTFKQGFGFVLVIAIASFAGVILTKALLPYPLVYVPLIGLILLHIFYATPKQIPPFLKVFLLLALSAIPFLGLQSLDLAMIFAGSLVFNGAATVVLVWFVYGFIPDPFTIKPTVSTPKPPPPEVPKSIRFQNALISTIVVFPVLLMFYFFEWTSALTSLIFVMILAMQPGFAKNFKAGKLMILANIGGGIAAIIGYELLVITPLFPFLLLLVVFFGLSLFEKLLNNAVTTPDTTTT